MAAFSSSSSVEELPPQHQVFISFRGTDLREGFVIPLVKALLSNRIKVFIDMDASVCPSGEILSKRIEGSRIALVIFTDDYTESKWFLRVLAKIKGYVDEGKLVAIPIFYKLDPSIVRGMRLRFGDVFKDVRSISYRVGINVKKFSPSDNVIENVVEEVKKELNTTRRELPFIRFAGAAQAHSWKPVRINRLGQINSFSSPRNANSSPLPHASNQTMPSQRSKDVEEVKKESNTIPSEGSHKIKNVVEEVKKESNTIPSDGSHKIENVVEEGKKESNIISSEGSHKNSVDPFENSDTRTFSAQGKDKTFGIKQRLNELKVKLELNKVRSQLGMIIGCVLLLLFVLQQIQIAYMSTHLICEGGAINNIVENVPKVLECIPAEGTENPRDAYTEFRKGKYGAKPERSSSNAKTNADFLDRTFTKSLMDGEVKPPKNIQVFINFRGDQLRYNFVSYLVDALRRSEINVFIDNQEQRGEDLNSLFKRIDDSGIAIVVFSSRYTESKWCLEELVRIKERVHQGLLKVLPIYYKVTPTNVKRLQGEFGDHFRDKEYVYESDEPKIKRWKEAIAFVSHKFALTLDEKSSALEIDFVETIVKEVLRMLQAISKVESSQSSS